MRLDQYKRLYQAELKLYLEGLTTADLIKNIIDRYSIKDWKEFEKEISNK